MRFKRAMAASMAAVMAVSSAVVCQVTASAASSALYTIDKGATQSLQNPFGTNDVVKSINKIVLNITASSDGANGELYLNVGGGDNVQLYYNNSDKKNNVTLKGGEATNVTLDISAPMNQYWYVLDIKSYWDSIDVNSISAYNGDTLISKIYKPTFDGTKVSLTDNTNNIQGSAAIKLSEVSNASDLVSKYSKVTVKVPIQGAVSLIDDSAFDPAEMDYMLQASINYAEGGSYPWIVSGDSKYDAATNSVYLTWDLASAVNSNSDVSSKGLDKYAFQALNLVARTSSIKSPVDLYFGEPTVLVGDFATNLKISTTIDNEYYVDDTVSLSTNITPDEVVDKAVTWSSSDENVAVVDKDGKVTAVSVGETEITAKLGNLTDTVKINVAKKKVTATITAGDVTGATKEDAADKAKAAVKVVSDDLTDKDYTVSVKADGRKYMATVVLTEEAAKKYELTGTNTASGTIAYKVTGLKLSTNKLAIPVTSTAGVKITATIQPEDLADGEVEWKTADNKVATVEDGLVKPVSGSAGGKTTITATVKGTTYSADCEVSIAEVINPATAIKLDKSELSGTAGDNAELKADVTAKDDTKECTDVVIWESSDEKVATVNAGSVTFVGEGTATITATAGGQSATCKVTVKAKVIAVEKVTLDKTSAELTVGDTATLKATVTPDDATDKTVTWTSSDESVATVKDGVVTAVKAGTATITAKADGKTAECRITVKAKSQPVKETVLWSGNTDLGTDWNKNVTVPKANVKIGDVIRIKVGTGSAEYHQIKIMDSSWNVLSSLKSRAHSEYGTIDVDKDGYVEFTVNAADAKLISEGGLILSGYDLTVSSVSNKAMKDETYAPSTKVHTVVNNGTSQIAVFAISEEDAEKYESYTIIITRGSDGKSVYEIVDGCYKYVSYNNGTEDIRISGNGAYYIMLDITGIEDSFGGITVRIVPSVPKG